MNSPNYTDISKTFIILILALLFTMSCRTSKTDKTYKDSDKEFYKKYSKILGVELKGNEDKKLIKTVADWLGVRYKYGGDSKRGTDCSGFVKTVYETIYKVKLYRSASDLMKNTETVNKRNLQAGDLVFFKINGKDVSHVGIYLGESKFIHASTTKGVIVSDLNMDYYKKSFYCGGRIKDLKK